MNESWDVVVIGAGPAGALAAREAAREGARVLLVERHALPRPKVCGCCVNGSALATLERVGLGGVPARLGGVPTRRLRWLAGGRCATVPLRGGVSVSRPALDMALAAAAENAGAVLRTGVSAKVLTADAEAVRIRLGDAEVTAAVVVVADGLGGRSLDDLAGFEPTVSPTSRMGAGTVVEGGDLEPGVIQMACGRGGYVGFVRLEDGRLDIAAALDTGFVRAHGGPGEAAATVLHEAGATVPDGLTTASWKGTPGLTRRRTVAGTRVLVVGDAAGYVEPFTGEGMAWAMAGGVAAGALAAAAAGRGWSDATAVQWRREHARRVRRRQWLCRAAAWTLRRPRLVSGLAGIVGAMPALATPATAMLARPPRRPATAIALRT